MADQTIVQDVIHVLRDALRIGARADRMDAATPLLGAIPELDSMAVVAIVTALEEKFGFTLDDDEISGAAFESVGTLASLVETKLGA